MPNIKHHAMNEHLVEGRIKAAAGKVQRQASKVTGSNQQEVKGSIREQADKVEQAVNDLRKVLRESGKH